MSEGQGVNTNFIRLLHTLVDMKSDMGVQSLNWCVWG
jgi:hypothetical protein